MNASKQPRSGLTLMEMTLVLAIMAVLAAMLVPIIKSSNQSASLDATYITMCRIRDAIMGGKEGIGYRRDMQGLSSGRTDSLSLLADAAGLPRDPYMSELLVFQNGFGINNFLLPAYNPQTQRGWRAPYLTQTNTNMGGLFGLPASYPLVLDSFVVKIGNETSPGRPIVIQWPTSSSGIASQNWQHHVRLVSYGPNGLPSTVTNLSTGGLWNLTDLTLANYDDDVILYIRRDVSGMDWTNYWEQKTRY